MRQNFSDFLEQTYCVRKQRKEKLQNTQLLIISDFYDPQKYTQ